MTAEQLNTVWHPNYWCLLNKMEEIFGYSVEALRSKIQRAQLVQGVHWRKGPDGRVLMNPCAFTTWLLSEDQV